MLFYSATAFLTFSFVTYVFLQDDYVRKNDVQTWLFIAFAAVIWPLTLPNMMRKVVTKSIKHQRAYRPSSLHSKSYFAYEALQESSFK